MDRGAAGGAAARRVARTGGAGFEPRLRFEGDDFRTVLALVASGLGVALLPRLAMQRVPPAVAVRPLADPPITRRLYTARLRTAAVPPAVAGLEAAIRERAAQPT